MNENLDCMFEGQDRQMFLDVNRHFSNVSFVFVDEIVDDLDDSPVRSEVLLESVVQLLVDRGFAMDDNDMHWKQKVLTRKRKPRDIVFIRLNKKKKKKIIFDDLLFLPCLHANPSLKTTD